MPLGSFPFGPLILLPLHGGREHVGFGPRPASQPLPGTWLTTPGDRPREPGAAGKAPVRRAGGSETSPLEAKLRQRIAELERKVGQQAVEIDFLKGCLQRIEYQRMLQALTGNPRSTGRSKKK